MTAGNDTWRDLGDTDLDHYQKSVSRSYQGSGVSGMGKEAPTEFTDLSAAHLSRFAAAIAWHETMNGTWPGPIPFNYHNPFAMVAHASMPPIAHPPHVAMKARTFHRDEYARHPHSVAKLREGTLGNPRLEYAARTGFALPKGHAWANYPTYADAVRDWIHVVTGPNSPFKNTKTIAEFIHVYAPSNDGNDEAAYINAVCLVLDRDVPRVGPPSPTPPPPPPPPPVDVDPIAVIVHGSYGDITYGFGADAGLDYYAYGTGHGTQRDTQHTGDDVPVPRGTRLYTPCDGTVLCVGSAGGPNGAGWGNACGSYPDRDGSGASGNITVLLDAGSRLTLGHCSSFNVGVGQKVKAGDLLGRSGGMNGPHVHVEMAICDQSKVNMAIAHYPGCYFLVEPVAALKAAMQGHKPVVYADRLPVPQPAAFTTFCNVAATQDGVPVLQRADLTSPAVRAPLSKGESFDAVMLILGDDRQWYWISSLGSRIPVSGTFAPAGPVVPGAIQ